MAESEYIKIRRADLKEALLAAYEWGWSGTPEVAESVVLTILAGMSKSITPAMDESVIIQKLSSMMGNEWDKKVYGGYGDGPLIVKTSTGEKRAYLSPPPWMQKSMYDEWDENL